MEHQGDSFTFNLKINGFDGLYTLRQEKGETIEEFREKIINVSKKLSIDGFEPKTFEKKATYPQSSSYKPVTAPNNSVAPQDLGTCRKCGAPNKWSANKGKAYCGAMCWKTEKSY